MSHAARVAGLALLAAVAAAVAGWLAWQGRWVALLVAAPLLLLVLGLAVQAVGIRSREEDPGPSHRQGGPP